MVGAASLRAEHCTTWVLETSRLSPRPRPMTDRGRNLNVCATTRGSRNIGCHQPVDAVARTLDRDHFMNAEEALAWQLVDQVYEPRTIEQPL